jgi:predicted esterase
MNRNAGIAVAVTAAVGAVIAVAAVAMRRPSVMYGLPAAPPVPTAADVPAADWCAPGFDPIPGGACFAVPPANQVPSSLVVYLHGRYSRDVTSEEVDRQRRLGQRATARGIAVIAFRGQLGECTAPELATWFCWPSNERNADDATAFVGAWSGALAAAEERIGSHARYVLGFSNGAYFAGLLAVRGLFEAKAYVVAHGGPVEPLLPRVTRAPILLLSADDDISQDEMIRFGEDLARESWAHDSYARSGGHALTDEDIDAALAFFSRADEPLPLDPPLPLHRAVHHDHDAGGGADAAPLAGSDDTD